MGRGLAQQATASMGPPPVPLLDELVEEILLRIPPSDPATLARAAVAQKRWCRLVTDRGFRRRYRARHRVPPMLGFFYDNKEGDGFSASFVPAFSFGPKPRAEGRRRRPEDARHGRVLFRANQVLCGSLTIRGFGLVVWDPITRHRVALPRPKDFCNEWNWKAAVLCAAPFGSCDHLDCHRGHFIVVLIGSCYPRASVMLSCVYSSQTGAWSEIIFARHLGDHCLGYDKGTAHVGNALYCMLYSGNKILKYDLGTREFSVMEPPVMLSHEKYTRSEGIELTTIEDGQLGLAVLRQSTLHILSTDEGFGWGGTKIIDLEKCDNYVPSTTTPSLIGFAGDVGLAFINSGNNGILSVDIRSAKAKVVCKVNKTACISRIVPYINFCTPAMGVTKRKNGAGVGASSGGQSCVASRLPSQAVGVPTKDDKPREGASRDVQSCVASSLLRQVIAVRKGNNGPIVGASSGGRSSVATRLPNKGK